MAKVVKTGKPAGGGLRGELQSAGQTMGVVLNQRGLHNSLRWASTWHFKAGSNSLTQGESGQRHFRRVKTNLATALQKSSALALMRSLAGKMRAELQQYTDRPPQIDLDYAVGRIAGDESFLHQISSKGVRLGLSLANFLAERGDHRAWFEQRLAEALERTYKPSLRVLRAS